MHSDLKEVIQPHVPVRLPCGDLAPLAEPKFESVMKAKPHLDSTRLAWRAVWARSRDVFGER